MDGNKRTGLLAGAMFLGYNGWVLDMDDDQLEAFALDIAGARERGKEPIGMPEIAERSRRGARRVA